MLMLVILPSRCSCLHLAASGCADLDSIPIRFDVEWPEVWQRLNAEAGCGQNCHLGASPAGVPVWPLKLLIFVAGITLLIAGAAEVMRCIVCIRTGKWPRRSGDVEELEKVLIEQHEAEEAK